MDRLAFEHHLHSPVGEGQLSHSPHRGSAGGAACGDLVDFRVLLEGPSVRAGFDAEGCGALTAAASAISSLANGSSLFEAARISVPSVSLELGELSASKIHAAELAVDAFHRALGSCASQATEAHVCGRVLVAMSGGVDSAVAAVLSSRRGEAVGVTLELWRDSATDAESSCCSHVAVRRARSMAHELGLAHFTLDLRDEFRRGVVDPWLDGYARGETPNPCVRCNGEVRIAPMVDLADRLGAERLVTGHYAQLSEVDDPSGPLLVAGVDESKDQAYALARVPGAVLSKLELPLGSLRKTQVRELAAEMGLAAASAPDSQDLCFLAGMGREAFLQRHSGLGDDPGEVVGTDGIEISRHRGVHHHTVGQRKGLGIGGGVPLYVIGTDASNKKVTVGPREALSTTRVELTEVDLRRDAPRVTSARLRHRAPVAAARLTMTDSDSGVLELATPLDRVASGQMACLLDGEIVIGSATVRACGA